MSPALARLRIARYVEPRWRTSSIPGVVEVEGGARFVAKFLGAGGGARALACELVAGCLADALGVPVPPRALLDMDEGTAIDEEDPEILQILRASSGPHFGSALVRGAYVLRPGRDAPPSLEWAARVMALDVFLMNVDRTRANPNVLLSGSAAWAIDHDALLLFQLGEGDPLLGAGGDARDHLFAEELAAAPELARAAARELAEGFDPDLLGSAVDPIPPEWADEAEKAGLRALLRARLERWDFEAMALRGI